MSVRCTAVFETMGLAFLAASQATGQQGAAALDRTLLKTHMRQETTSVAITDKLVQAFPPTTIQCGDQTCTVRVEVSAQFSTSRLATPFDSMLRRTTFRFR